MVGHAVHVADKFVGGGGDVSHIVHRVGTVGEVLHTLAEAVDKFGTDMSIFEHLVEFGSQRVGTYGCFLDGIAVLVEFYLTGIESGFVDHTR